MKINTKNAKNLDPLQEAVKQYLNRKHLCLKDTKVFYCQIHVIRIDDAY